MDQILLFFLLFLVLVSGPSSLQLILQITLMACKSKWEQERILLKHTLNILISQLIKWILHSIE